MVCENYPSSMKHDSRTSEPLTLFPHMFINVCSGRSISFRGQFCEGRSFIGHPKGRNIERALGP